MDNSGFLPRGALQSLLEALTGSGYRIIGPQVRDNAIQYLDLADVAQLPAGWTDDQAPGSYHLSRVDSPRYVAWATGPQALKPYVFRSREVLWQSERDATGKLDFIAPQSNDAPVAIIGARACDLAALAQTLQSVIAEADQTSLQIIVHELRTDERAGATTPKARTSTPRTSCTRGATSSAATSPRRCWRPRRRSGSSSRSTRIRSAPATRST